ncbi:MAG: hypothetical protein MUC81_06555 [Bacteroidia bacterium]|jgi:hypothetical protein|nr:hypothetical protein [Bacteroidia bacterium]
MNILNRFLFLSCIKATEAVEKQEVVGLSLVDKIRLRKHLSICKACKMYASFSKKADAVLQKMVDDELVKPYDSTKELEEKVIKKIFSE